MQLDLLSKYERRVILRQLQTTDTIELSDIVRLDDRCSPRAKTELAHNHLPRLNAEGYINWDRNTGTIRRGDRFNQITPILELLEPLMKK